MRRLHEPSQRRLDRNHPVVHPALADPRVADLVQAGKIRVALFPPQYVQNAATGYLRPFEAGVVSMAIARGLAGRLGVQERLAYVIEFIEAAKTSDLIQRAIDDAGLRGVRVAAPMKPE